MSNESMANYVTDTPSDICELLARFKSLEAKNGELETWKNKAKEKMPAMQMRIHELEVKLEIADGEWKAYYNSSIALGKKLEIACGELLSHCAWENTKDNCDCSACKALAAINGEGV